jgi:hypothetical protein
LDPDGLSAFGLDRRLGASAPFRFVGGLCGVGGLLIMRRKTSSRRLSTFASSFLSPMNNPISKQLYPPFGSCIYCGALRYSEERPKLAIEHIIPEALDGEITLPEASCGECEKKINQFEQYCMRQMLGQVRSLLGMRSKRPHGRPATVPVELFINGQWETRDVPVQLAPVSLLLPFFDPPDFLSVGAPIRTNINTRHFKMLSLGPKSLYPLHQQFGATKGRTYQGSLLSEKFALLLAKIAHGFATAEKLDRFNPVLPDTILSKPGAPPLPFFIGGLPAEPPSEHTHELRLSFSEEPSRFIWAVDVRLFGWLEAPTYRVVVSVDPPLARLTKDP